jgi:hypothetical protein
MCGWIVAKVSICLGANVEKVICCISEMARWGLTRLKEKKQRGSRQELDLDRALGNVVEFTDRHLTTDHPAVDPALLRRLWEIDKNLVLCWELQFYFEHRWHVKLVDRGEMISIVLLQDPPYPIKASQTRAEYVPFDSKVLGLVERLMFQWRNGLQAWVVEEHLAREQEKIDARERDRMDVANEMDKDLRRINERITGKRNISDPGWERGIGFDADGKPFAEGRGAHTEKNTRAI